MALSSQPARKWGASLSPTRNWVWPTTQMTKEADSPGGTPEWNTVLPTPHAETHIGLLTSNCKTVNLHCFKSLSLWWFVMAAVEMNAD